MTSCLTSLDLTWLILFPGTGSTVGPAAVAPPPLSSYPPPTPPLHTYALKPQTTPPCFRSPAIHSGHSRNLSCKYDKWRHGSSPFFSFELDSLLTLTVSHGLPVLIHDVVIIHEWLIAQMCREAAERVNTASAALIRDGSFIKLPYLCPCAGL